MVIARHYLIALILLLAAGCTPPEEALLETTDTDPSSYVYSLDDSTIIIMNLIQNNDLAQILEETDSEKVDSLIKNFSPAEIAFESEVLNCTLPVIVYFFNGADDTDDTAYSLLESYAQQYEDRVKFVTVDINLLGKIAEKANVQAVPTVITFKNRQEISHISGPLSQQSIQDLIDTLLAPQKSAA